MNPNELGCHGHRMLTRSGRWFDLTDPCPGDFTFADIAGALSKLCRYGGHITAPHYSVAEHSVWCAWQAKRDGLSVEIQIAALMHDAAEAFIGDVIRPLKRLLGEPYRQLEERIMRTVRMKFLLGEYAEEVRKIDLELLVAERRVMVPQDPVELAGTANVRRLDPPFQYAQAEDAERMFRHKAQDLGINTNV